MIRTIRAAALLMAAALPLAGAHAQGVALGGDEPVEIESDRLEVRDRDNTAIFTGNVVLVQGDLLLRTVKLTVFYTETPEAGGKAPAAAPAAAAAPAQPGASLGGGTEVERMLAEGKVYLDQGGQVVTGDRGEFAMKTGLMVVTGKEVVLTQGGTVVVGCRFTTNNKSGQSQVESCPNSQAAGRVRMLLQPEAQQN